VPRVRTTKALAQRIDLNYFKRPIPIRRWRFWLCLLLPLISFVWIGWKLVAKDYQPYSSGPLSAGHVLLTRECTTCHKPEGNAVFTEHASDQACKSCHDGPIHQVNQTREPECGSCHVEHRGSPRLIATSNQSCAQCHANLQTNSGASKYFKTISSFNTDHPEMAVFRATSPKDPVTIKVNHYVHMKKDLLGPHGKVQLECKDCHRQPGSREAWKYGSSEALPVSARAAAPAPLVKADIYAPDPDRALMTMPKFTESCSACHLLQFDKRFAEQVPHDKPDVVHAFVVKKFEAYIAAHPAELREQPEEERRLPSRPAPPAARMVTPSQWVAERTKEAESLLWGKTCRQCHAITITEGQPLPKVADANYTQRWLPRARFDHDAHRGFACASCHDRATKSQDSAELLLPKLATCKDCHAPGPAHVESRCFECHAYHDWSKRKEIVPTFVPKELSTQAIESSHLPGQ
jgi:cytochrome c5